MAEEPEVPEENEDGEGTEPEVQEAEGNAPVRLGYDGARIVGTDPRFIEFGSPELVFDRVRGLPVKRDALLESYPDQADEVGDPSDEWASTHFFHGVSFKDLIDGGGGDNGGGGGTPVLAITDPTDGFTTDDPNYSISGEGAEADADVELWSDISESALETVTAGSDGTFQFNQGSPAPVGDTTWHVKSGSSTSASITVTVTEAA